MTNPVGRPAQYNPDFHITDLVDKMKQGLLDCEIFAEWDISKNTFYRWLRENEDLKDAYERGFEKGEAHLVGKFRRMMDGELEGKHSFNAAIALANNKYKWSKGSTSDIQTQININNMNVIDHNQSNAELLEFIHIKLKETKIVSEPIKQINVQEVINDAEFDEHLNESDRFTEQKSEGTDSNSGST